MGRAEGHRAEFELSLGGSDGHHWGVQSNSLVWRLKGYRYHTRYRCFAYQMTQSGAGEQAAVGRALAAAKPPYASQASLRPQVIVAADGSRFLRVVSV